MSLPIGHLYEFGPFRLEPAERRLLRDGQQISLPPKALDVLVVLVSRADHLVTKEDLLKEVWTDTFVEEASLSYTVSLLRKALHAGADQVRYIETVQKLGYRFTSPVRTLTTDGSTADIGALPPASPLTAQVASMTAALPAVKRSRLWSGASPRQRATMAIGVLGLLVAAVVLGRYTHEVAPPAAPARFEETIPGHIILTDWDHPVMSPDGRRVAFTGVSEGRRHVWVRPLQSSAPILLPGTEGGNIPFWSPDSKSLAFFAHRKLKRIDVDRGQPITLCCDRFPIGNTFGAWSSSGVILFANGPIYRVPETGGAPEQITRLDAGRHEARHYVIGFLSDARRFIFFSDPPPTTYYVTSLDDPTQRHPLSIGATGRIEGLSNVRDHLLYAREGVVVAQPFDEQTLTPRGAPLTLAHTDAAPWQPRPSASRTGIVVFRSNWYTLRQLAWRRRDGTPMGVIGKADVYTAVELSPSGTRAVVVQGGSGWIQDRDLWLANLTNNTFERFTTHPGFESSPAWSPDERRIAYHSSQAGVISPFVKDLETRKEEQLFKPTEGLYVDDWTRTDTLVLRDQERAVYGLPLKGERKLQRLGDTTFGEDQMQVSPDGHWIAFNSEESKAWEVYVARFPEFTDKRRVSVAGGVQPRWRGNGRELFYLAPDGTMMVVPSDGSSRARPLFTTSLKAPSHTVSEFDVTSDGERFLVLEPASTRPQILTFLLNWSHAQ
jgi:eukaryotic-like serine/threonine-protein kinase